MLPATLLRQHKLNTFSSDTRKKQKELKRYRDILIATLDYSIDRFRTANLKFEEYDPIAHFEQLKHQTEEHFSKRRHTRLKQWLRDMTEEPRETGDLSSGRYIKEKTGYDIDIFGNFQKRIDKIIERKKIKTEMNIGMYWRWSTIFANNLPLTNTRLIF